jgi:hypothetical protein
MACGKRQLLILSNNKFCQTVWSHLDMKPSLTCFTFHMASQLAIVFALMYPIRFKMQVILFFFLDT